MRKLLHELSPIFLIFLIFSYSSAYSISLSANGSITTSTGNNGFCKGGNIILTASPTPGTSATSGSTYMWTLDGVRLQGSNSSTYSASVAGTYSVIVTSGDIADNSYSPLAIVIFEQPTSAFTLSPGSACAGNPVSFTNTSTGTALTYQWNFGDPNSGTANTSTLQNPSHPFTGITGNTSQSFSVNLITTNSAGCTASSVQTMNVLQSPDTTLGGTGITNYNGLTYFTTCGSTDLKPVFSFTNLSITDNTSYTIEWGDKSPNTTLSSFTTLNHAYSQGTDTLRFTVTGVNGCSRTGIYYVFVGSIPAVGLASNGGTSICTGGTLSFPVSGNHARGTTYTVTYSDVSTPEIYTDAYPIGNTITHTFLKSSIGYTTATAPAYPNAFFISIQASNPCSPASASYAPIYVSDKPKALINTGTTDSVFCINNLVNLTNPSFASRSITTSGKLVTNKFVWRISTVKASYTPSGISGLGTDRGSSDPNLWTSGSSTLSLSYNAPGIYSIHLKTGSNCGIDSTAKNIYINPLPIATFTVDNSTGCGPYIVTTTNTSTPATYGNNTYLWTITKTSTSCTVAGTDDYKFLNQTTVSSTNPQIQFLNPGNYNLALTTTSPGSGNTCTATSRTTQIIVKAKPSVILAQLSSICQNSSVSPSATVDGCNSSVSTTYSWSFPSGSPSSSTQANPGPITYATSGTFTITLNVTNDCGTTTQTQQLIVNQVPIIKQPVNYNYCNSEQTGIISFSSTPAATSYTWSNTNTSIGLAENGTGNIPSFTARNSTSSPNTSNVTVTPISGCPGEPVSFTITVNPQPAAPSTTPLVYCLNDVATALTATPTSGNTLNWYSDQGLANKLASPPIPTTSTAGTTSYYVTQTNNYGCEGMAASLTVTVNPIISNNTILSSQVICNGSAPTPLTGNSITGGNGIASYTYQWQILNSDGTTWSNLSDASATSQAYTPGVLSSTTQYRRQAKSLTCSSTSNTVTITIQPSLSNFDISSNQTICSNTQPAALIGQQPVGGSGQYTYDWQRSPDQLNWVAITPGTSINSVNYTPAPLTATTYFRRVVTSGSCTASSTAINITVLPVSVISPITSSSYCNNSTVPATQVTSSTVSANTTYTWTNDNAAIGLAASGTGNIPAFTSTNTTKSPLIANITITPTYTSGSISCMGTALTYAVSILPTITISAIQNMVICANTLVATLTPVNDASAYPGASVSYSWTSLPNIGLTNATGPKIPAFTTINTGTTDILSTITVTPIYLYLNAQCSGTATRYNLTVKAPVTIANAGTPLQLCNQIQTTLSANTPGPGLTGTWSSVAGSGLAFDNINAPAAIVTGLAPGTNYTLTWTITSPSCAPTSSNVSVTDYIALTNQLTTESPTVCAGQQVTIPGPSPTGGNQNNGYLYTWESSSDQTTWAPINGKTAPDLTFTPPASAYVRRTVVSDPCTLESNSVYITVQPALANNILSADQQVCINKSVAAISGTLPSGGDGKYTYQWQQSIDNSIWNLISGADQINYQPAPLLQTTYFRRIATTTHCTGQQQSTSLAVKILVNLNAKAEFTATTLIGCVPFDLLKVITPIAHDDLNKSYQWFANGVALAGTGITFPGTIMTADGQTVVIKLEATSIFGCDTNSQSMTFHTVKVVHAAYTKDQVKGCGPLTVNFTNTSIPATGGTYLWNFGNGITSTSAQPGPITFLQNPAIRDTTYKISLTAFTTCGFTVFMDSVTVRPLPKAVFSPDKTIGCSPLTINISNQSKGMPNTYTFDFGNGDVRKVVSSNQTFQYTYQTVKTETVNLKMIAQNECGKDSSSYNIVVYPNTVQANLVVNGNSKTGCAPFTVLFFNNSAGANQFNYDFKDGTTLTTLLAPEIVSHTFVNAGTYPVSLAASNGCSAASAIQTITVVAPPSAGFTISRPQYCLSDSAEFTNSTNTMTAFTYLWNFGDGSTSNQINTKHLYLLPGTYQVSLTALQTIAGVSCNTMVSKSITILPLPVATFSTNASSLNCSPFNLTVTSTSGIAAGYSWNFGDATNILNTSSGHTASHSFTKKGSYTIKLIAYNQTGCLDSSSQTIKVTESPIALFTPGDTSICGISGALNFTNNSTYGGSDQVNYEWLVNNIVVSVQKNLSYYFNLPTTAIQPYQFHISLIATSSIGCSDTMSHTIQFNPLPISKFSVAQLIGCTPFKLTIANTSVYADYYSWYINNVLVSSQKIPTALVLKNPNSTYTIRLVTTNQYGCKSDSSFQTVSTYPRPTAAFTLKDSISCTGLLVLHAQNTSVGASAYQWDFGDNSPVSTTTTPVHTYGIAGSYNLSLITFNGVCYDTITHLIEIANPPKASFSANVLTGCTQLTTSFQNLSVNATAFSWDFGDNTYSSEKNPVHTYGYTQPAYTVKLIATGQFGCSDQFSIQNYISVSAPPRIDFIAMPDSIIKIPARSFTFKDLTIGNVTSYNWSFGDGKTSTLQNPGHTYFDIGKFAVTLAVKTMEGCTLSRTRTVEVASVPQYLYVPNAFEPGNSKPEIQSFSVLGTGMAMYTLRVFNNLGQLIYQSSDLDANGSPTGSWNGMYRNQQMPQGVYIWTITARFLDGTQWLGMKYLNGKSYNTTGNINLIR